MKIRNRYSDPSINVYSEAGTSVVPAFKLDAETKTLVEVGKRDLVEEINSYAESTDMAIILNALHNGSGEMVSDIINGKFTARADSYFDTTIMPENIFQYKKMVDTAYEKYNSLPKEIRENFDTIDDFINASDDKLQTIITNYNNSISVSHDDVSNNNENEKGE